MNPFQGVREGDDSSSSSAGEDEGRDGMHLSGSGLGLDDSQEGLRDRLDSSGSDHLSSHAIASNHPSPATSPQRLPQTSSQPAPAPPPQHLPHATNPTYTPGVPFKLCIECEDQSAEVICIDCDEDFCRPCWAFQHRRGKRSEHRTEAIIGELMAAPQVPATTDGTVGMVIVQQATAAAVAKGGEADDPSAMAIEAPVVDDMSSSQMTTGEEDGGGIPDQYEDMLKRANEHFNERYMRSFYERARSTPLRLTEDERMLLRVLESALNVSEYTDNVDTVSRKSKSTRVIEELESLFGTILGLMVCSEPHRGHELIGRDVADNGEFFRDIFEIGRRYKIMNPDKMRNTYGKLMYMLQDTQSRFIQPNIGFCCVKDIITVTSFLEERGALTLLQDARILIATRDISDKGGKCTREEIAKDIMMKQTAARELKVAHASDCLPADDIQRVLDSIADANNYLTFNVGPVRRMIKNLTANFETHEIEQGFSLAIGGGNGRYYKSRGASSSSFSMYGGGYGSSYFRTDSAKLCHDHATHYTYVWQSLRLWREIMQNMYRLWYKADHDLLSTQTTYQLLNTGQGLNRVQICPKVGSEMRNILGTVQRECGNWVGLSVVHLGDRDVPNALMFIDKYTQVPHILTPVAKMVDQCAGLFENEALKVYAIDVWDTPENLKMHVLVDFFKHAFDGDGDDGGSCIDGRLTSAWNWCSKIAKKPYYYAFMLASFQGFDGDPDSWKDK